MSAPDPKAVEAAIAYADTLTPAMEWRRGHFAVLIAAARAYLRTPTAPQGAEPVVRFISGRDGKEPEALQPDEDAAALVAKFDRHYPRDAPHMILYAYAAPQGAEIARELLVEAMDLVPRMSDDDPIAPALAEWLRKVRAALSPAAQQPTETKR